MDIRIDLDRFFDETRFKTLVSLTQEEAQAIQEFELGYEYHNGLRSISGGFACITFEGFDEGDTNILLGHLKSGIQSDCENVVYKDQITFNRTTKKFKFD